MKQTASILAVFVVAGCLEPVEVARISCDSHSDCPAGSECSLGFCALTCATDAQCGCGSQAACIGGACLECCGRDQDCAEGFTCSNSLCKPASCAGSSGPKPDVVQLVVEVPALPVSAPCAYDPSQASALMKIGGHQDCSLVVGMDGTASGECERVTVGIARPLMVVYEATLAGTELRQLAYAVGSVDLRSQSIRGCEPISVSSLTMFTTDADLASSSMTSTGDQRDAENWAGSQTTELSYTLDHDSDGQTNLQEACAGTLD